MEWLCDRCRLSQNHAAMVFFFFFLIIDAFFKFIICWANYISNYSDEIDLNFLRKQFSDCHEDDCFEKTKSVKPKTFAIEECNNTDFSVGNYVVFNFEVNFFSRKVIEKKDGGYIPSPTVWSKRSWKWLSKRNAIFLDAEDALYNINPPKQISNGGIFPSDWRSLIRLD